MTRRIYWGLAILIVLLVGVSVFLLTQTTDTEPSTFYTDVAPSKSDQSSTPKLEETDKFTKGFEEGNATLVSDDTEQAKGNMSDEQKADKTPDWNSLTPEHQKQIYNQFFKQFGLEVPPLGYTYRWEEPGIPKRDENGNPILHKRGDPIIDIVMSKAFTPTIDEYEMLKTLEIEIGWQHGQGDKNKAESLQSDYDKLYEKVQRERPTVTGWIWAAPKSEKSSDPDKPKRIASEKLKAALIEHGYSYLISILEEEGEL